MNAIKTINSAIAMQRGQLGNDAEGQPTIIPEGFALELIAARDELTALIEAAKNLRAYVGISTIQPGVKITRGWHDRVIAFDNALSKVEG